jgi:putative spermidine/putrescine transport system permease protein
MDERPISPFLKLAAAIMFVFMLAPVLIVIPISFSADNDMRFPPSGWSLRWYGAIFRDPTMVSAFSTSMLLGIATTVLCLAIALPCSYALVRVRPSGAAFLTGVFTAPLLLPSIVLGLALLVVLAPLGLLATFPGVLAAHLVITLPYAIRVLSTAIEGLPMGPEEAAATLGAPPVSVFLHVTLPLMRAGLVATAALCFLVSFDEVVLSLFMTGPRLTTLPVALFHHIENAADPLVAAVSMLLIVLTFAVVFVVDRTAGLTRTFVK